MKIGIDCRLWEETGVGRYTRNLIKELGKIDKENEYVLFVNSSDYQKVTSAIPSLQFKMKTVDIHWHSLSEQLQFVKVLNEEKLDLMHFPYFSLPVRYKRPFVVTIHDLIIHHFPTGKASTLPFPLYHVKRLGAAFVLRHGLQHARRIIVPLHAVKDDLQQTLHVPEEKIMVTYEGFDKSIANAKDQRPKTKDLKNRKYFLYVGNAYPHKNLSGLLEGFAEFKKHHDCDCKLVFVGKEDYFYQRLEQRIDVLQRQDLVFYHHLNDQELASLYEGACALVSASVMEGFGLPPLEAMALGAPVLVSDIPSFREVCGKAAIYFDPRNPDDLCRKMATIYFPDKKQLEHQVKAGLQRAKSFSWKKMAEETLSVYEQSRKA